MKTGIIFSCFAQNQKMYQISFQIKSLKHFKNEISGLIQGQFKAIGYITSQVFWERSSLLPGPIL